MDALFDKPSFSRQSPDFRIGAIVSDGMWWDIKKWKKSAKVTEDELYSWIEDNLSSGMLVQSETGARSYRFPLKSIQKWYDDHGLLIGTQLVDFLFPPRIWDDLTETEGFIEAPLREIGTVTFSCSSSVAEEVIQALKGIAKVREPEPGKYRAYSLSSGYTKSIISKIFTKYEASQVGKVYSRLYSKRREVVDFSPRFIDGMIVFYKKFARTLMKSSMDTIKIYLPDPEDQESQITYWVFAAIEKFDETSSVPFSGYLNSALSHWPYDLPYIHLGKDLSSFQRERAKAITALRKESGPNDQAQIFRNEDIASKMGMELNNFNELEEKHRIWIGTRKATTLTWEESADEKITSKSYGGSQESSSPSNDIQLAHNLSIAAVSAAINTGLYQDAIKVIAQIDASELDQEEIRKVDGNYIRELGVLLGVANNA